MPDINIGWPEGLFLAWLAIVLLRHAARDNQEMRHDSGPLKGEIMKFQFGVQFMRVCIMRERNYRYSDLVAATRAAQLKIDAIFGGGA